MKINRAEHYSSAHYQWRCIVTVEQVIAYVESLNMLFVNKVITRAEFRAALLATPLYGAVCQAPHAPKGKRKRG